MAISKKLRFEVFKRDGFACQYCGRTPPVVMLEVDHIMPRSEGGTDDINNLITSCFDCNRGKSNTKLEKIPTAIEINLDVLKEREAQAAEYNKFLLKAERRIMRDAEEIATIYASYFPDYELTDQFKTTSLRNFLGKLPKDVIAEAAHDACTAMKGKHRYDKASHDAIKYFCGMCWRRIKGE